ncbi:uncharacterized protein LOC117590839 [Drosophila guanche]|uniref:uncharacterized protein LOC117590839 n=1 Tax=Drosophila guanche TaxID=7266 RepID=UPI0014709462|nr:uncharacterized protein LOC117590839 [Drosophila guanche]
MKCKCRIIFIILLLAAASCVPFHRSPIYESVCALTGGRLKCYVHNSWGFNERTKKCYEVRKGKEPCGFFDGKKGCEDFCLRPPGTGRKG